MAAWRYVVTSGLAAITAIACGDSTDSDGASTTATTDGGGTPVAHDGEAPPTPSGSSTAPAPTSTGPTPPPTSTAPPPTVDAAPPSAVVDSGPPTDFDLTGTWATKTIVTGTVAGLTLPSTQFFLSELVQTGTTVRYSTRICEYELPSTAIATLTIPQPLADVFANKVVTAEGEYLSSTLTGATYAPATQVVVVGADLVDPADDPLPTATDLATAADEDADTNPGVTVDVDVTVPLCSGAGQIYVALRTGATLTGTVIDSNVIVGAADATLEQSVLGVSRTCLDLASGIAVDVLPDSPFEQLRIDGANGSPDLDADGDGAIDCAELIAGRDGLFSI